MECWTLQDNGVVCTLQETLAVKSEYVNGRWHVIFCRIYFHGTVNDKNCYITQFYVNYRVPG
jgi:DNA-directed RNA polymerase beta subunit